VRSSVRRKWGLPKSKLRSQCIYSLQTRHEVDRKSSRPVKLVRSGIHPFDRDGGIVSSWPFELALSTRVRTSAWKQWKDRKLIALSEPGAILSMSMACELRNF
jgi:hypothetical protein